MKDNVAPPPAVPSRYAPGIATRVLWLIIAFVMLAEVAIYIPSIANFRNNWLETRLSAAYIAALVLQAAPSRYGARATQTRSAGKCRRAHDRAEDA